jgi:penicillin-binding protein 1C
LRFVHCHRTFAVALLAVTAACAHPAWALTTFEEVKRDFRSSDTAVLDRNGELLQRVRTDATVRRGQWTVLADVSPALRTAMVLSEDSRFYEHSGIDWRAVSSAAWGNLWNTRTRGASTITMQLSGLLDEDLRRASGGRSFTQKIGQTVAAAQLERNWRKDQILEAYLNTVPFRGEIVGIDALSRTLFGKAPSGLDAREAAVAAALVRAPNARPARRGAARLRGAARDGARNRRSTATRSTCSPARRCSAAPSTRTKASRRMPRGGCCARLRDAATRRQPSPRPSPRDRGKKTTPRAPRSARACARRCSASRSTRCSATCANCATATWKTARWWCSTTRAAKCSPGSARPVRLSQAAEVDGVTALRQPGSTLKPLLYGEAIAERRITAASLIEDSSAQISTASGLYIPQNYDRRFKGPVSARTALAASLNVPAVRTLVMVSPESFARELRAAGLPLRESGDYYGYSLALGSAEVSLLSLANAYRMLANGGRYGTTTMTLRPRAPSDKSAALPSKRPRRPRPLRRRCSIRAPPSSSATSSPTRTRARAPSASTASSPPASGPP